MAKQNKSVTVSSDIDSTIAPAPVAPVSAPVTVETNKEITTMTTTPASTLSSIAAELAAAAAPRASVAEQLAAKAVNLDVLVQSGILAFVPQKHPLNALWDELFSLGMALDLQENPEFEAVTVAPEQVLFSFPASFDSEVGTIEGKRVVSVTHKGGRYEVENVLRNPLTGKLVYSRHGIMKNDARRRAKGMQIAYESEGAFVTGSALQDATFTEYRDILIMDGAVERIYKGQVAFLFKGGQIGQDSRELIGRSQEKAELFGSIQERNKYIILAQMHFGVQPILTTNFDEARVAAKIAEGKNGQALAELRRYQQATAQTARAEKAAQQEQRPANNGSRRQNAYDGAYHSNRRGGRGYRR